MSLELSRSVEEITREFKALSTPRDVAKLLETDYSRLVYHLYKIPVSKKYTVFEIPKKSGGARRITAPISPLKILQRKLCFVLSRIVEPKIGCHGYVLNRSIRTNALEHSGKHYIFTIDLLNFFPSINFGRVRGLFMAPPFKLNDKVATVLAQLCTHENSLPQGAPTSPVISNLICRKMDQQLNRLARKYGCNYSRYADDISFSTKKMAFPKAIGMLDPETKVTHVGEELSGVIMANGFAVNPKKVRLMHRSQQQIVTGLVSNEFPNVRRKFVRQIRAMIHAGSKYTLPAAEAEYNAKYFAGKHRNPSRSKPAFNKVLKGKINLLGMVKGELDPVYLNLLRKLQILDPSLVKAIPSPDWIPKIMSALFVIDSEMGESLKQGTGFALKGFGVVTCAHVLGEKMDVYQTSNPSLKYKVEEIISDQGLDVAVLRLSGFTGAELEKGDDGAVSQDSETVLAGFPNYAKGHSGSVTRARIIGTYLSFERKRFLIDKPIFYGNSGGPLLDHRRRVVGIAVTGSSELTAGTEDRHGVIPISNLDKLRFAAH